MQRVLLGLAVEHQFYGSVHFVLLIRSSRLAGFLPDVTMVERDVTACQAPILEGSLPDWRRSVWEVAGIASGVIVLIEQL